MTIQFTGEVHEFSFNTAYFTVTPQEYVWVGISEKDAVWWKEWLRKRVKDELIKMGGGIIWWRIEPEIEHAKLGCDPDKDPRLWTDEEKELAEKYFCWKGYARLATSPPLPENIVTILTDSYERFREKCKELRQQALATETA